MQPFEAVITVLDVRCNNLGGELVEHHLTNMLQFNDTLRDLMLQVCLVESAPSSVCFRLRVVGGY